MGGLNKRIRRRENRAKNVATNKTRKLLEVRLPQVIEVLIQKSLEGDMHALRLYMEPAGRLLQRGRIDNPGRAITTIKDAKSRLAANIESLQRGDIDLQLAVVFLAAP